MVADSALKLVLYLLAFAVKYVNLTDEQKHAFINFVEKMEGTGLAPIRLKKASEEILIELKKKKEEKV